LFVVRSAVCTKLSDAAIHFALGPLVTTSTVQARLGTECEI